MYAEMAWICPSLRRKSGIFVVGRNALGFFSHTGIQFLFSLRRISFRFGPTFFISSRRLLVLRSSCTMRRSSLLLVTFNATERSFRRLASSLDLAEVAFFFKNVVGLWLVFFFLCIRLISVEFMGRSSSV